MQIDSAVSIHFPNLLNSWLTPSTIVGVLAILVPLLLHWNNKRKLRPTMSHIEGIFDEYGSRLLFTIISNNPAGSRCGKLVISKKLFWKIFIQKTRIDYKINKRFLNPPRGETIPKYLIQGQETFITLLDSEFVKTDGIYKLTFYTSDGSCSNNFSHRLGKLFNRILQSPK